MYPWAYTWNPIGGRCNHACEYCYVTRLVKRGLEKYAKDPYLVEKELDTKLSIPDDKILFVCSCYDMFGDWVPDWWIQAILGHCLEYKGTTFLFQTKNTFRFLEYLDAFPPKTILGTTLESDKEYPLTKAPRPWKRYVGMTWIENQDKMVSIEPIMDFSSHRLLGWIRQLKPLFVSIGADSGKNNLPEPTPEQVEELISELQSLTEVRVKKNLNRLLAFRRHPP